MFQPLKGHLQGVLVMHSISMGQHNESPVVKFTLVCSAYYLCTLRLKQVGVTYSVNKVVV